MGLHASALAWDAEYVCQNNANGEIEQIEFADPLLAMGYLLTPVAQQRRAYLHIFELSDTVLWWSEIKQDLAFCTNLIVLTLKDCDFAAAAELATLLLTGVLSQLHVLTIDFITDSAYGITGSRFSELLNLFPDWEMAAEWNDWDAENEESEEPMCLKVVFTRNPVLAKARRRGA